MSVAIFLLLVSGVLIQAYRDLSQPGAWDYWSDRYFSPSMTASRNVGASGYVNCRTRPSRIYTLLGLLGHPSSVLERLQTKHRAFLNAYRGQQWSEAERLLVECEQVGVARLSTYYARFAARIAAFRSAPPPPGWDGSFALTEK